jgi:hypothetical protein
MRGEDLDYSDFLDRKNLVDRQILRLAKKGILNVGVVSLGDNDNLSQ